MIQYPKAVWKPLQGHSSAGTLRNRVEVTLHITDGPSEVSAFNTFQNSPEGDGGLSAHFCVDRDGTVYQYVDLNNTAWHASGVNDRSVGIEHVAMTQNAANYYNKHGGSNYVEMPATPQQYQASGELVCWLCKLLNIPPDRTHVREHCEAAPHDGHAWCCHAELNPDAVVAEASRRFFAITSATQRVLLAMGPGRATLTPAEILNRLRHIPGDFVPGVDAVEDALWELNRSGEVDIMAQRGRILETSRSHP